MKSIKHTFRTPLDIPSHELMIDQDAHHEIASRTVWLFMGGRFMSRLIWEALDGPGERL